MKITGKGPSRNVGGDNPRALLDAARVRLLRQRAARGESQAELAREFGVHRTTVSAAVTRKIWKHVE